MVVAIYSHFLRPLEKVLGSFVRWGTFGLRYTNILLAIPWSLARLTAHYRVLRKAQVVVVMLHPSGFGHTICGPDVARRLFPGCRCVFIVLSQNLIHNWKVSDIWPDIDVIFLRFKLGLKIPNTAPATQIAVTTVRRFVRMVAGSQVLFLGPSLLNDLYARVPIPTALQSSITRLSPNHRWLIGYFKLQKDVLAPPVRLPVRWRNKVRRVLNRALPPTSQTNHTPLCGMYFRQKGVNSGQITEWRRNGSPFEDYMPAIRLLNRAGYQVLLTGGVALSSSLYVEFSGMLVDGKNLGINKQIFDLYAATEVDIFIGEAGGGIFLPGVNNIPRLLVNAFPYYFAVRNSWVYYKTVRDQTGKLVHYAKLFSDHAYDYELAGMTLHNNSAEEICEAVSCFLEDVPRAHEPDPNKEIIAQLSDNTWIKQANARLSPAWLKLYDGEMLDKRGANSIARWASSSDG